MTWAKEIIHWRDEDTVNVSVVFTWHLPLAYKFCKWNTDAGLKVIAGGPAVDLLWEWDDPETKRHFNLNDVADCGGQMFPLPLSRHNGDATFTTRGCIRQCSFCAVPKIEGAFRELTDWIPAPIVCDNNLLASSPKHFDDVIDKLKVFKGVDFNQGLDIRLLNAHHIERLQELKSPKIRFAWDDVNDEKHVTDAINRMSDAGFPRGKIGVYVLIGNSDTPEDALYRLVTLRDVLKVTPFPMRFQPLYTLTYNEYIAPGWTKEELEKMMMYWARQNWFKNVPYSEFNDKARKR